MPKAMLVFLATVVAFDVFLRARKAFARRAADRRFAAELGPRKFRVTLRAHGREWLGGVVEFNGSDWRYHYEADDLGNAPETQPPSAVVRRFVRWVTYTQPRLSGLTIEEKGGFEWKFDLVA